MHKVSDEEIDFMLEDMKEKGKFPFRFFIVTFIWSWLIWLPLVLAGFKIIPIGKELLAAITIPVSILAAFGPAVGAFVSLRTLKGKGSISIFLKSFLSLNFGCKVWITSFAILGISTAIAWYIPELFGETRLPMILPNIYIFPVYWLIMIFLGGGQEEIGWRGFLVPELAKFMSFTNVALTSGLIWSVCHWPMLFKGFYGNDVKPL